MWFNKYITLVVFLTFLVNGLFFYRSFSRVSKTNPLPDRSGPPSHPTALNKAIRCYTKSEDDLSTRISMVVAVHVSNPHRFAVVKETWANCANVPSDMELVFVFFTSFLQQDDSITVKFHLHSNAWEKTSLIFSMLYGHYPNVQWFMKVDDDTIVYWDNLKEALLKRDPQKQWYIGYPIVFDNVVFASGGAGYVLSNSTLDLLLGHNFQRNCQVVGGGLPYRILEDVTMGKCLRKFGVEMSDQIGFHPHTPEQMIRWTLKGESYDHIRKDPFDIKAYPPITYQYITPQRMLVMANKSREIPHVIHQVWLNDERLIPQEMYECERMYKLAGWTYTRWILNQNQPKFPFELIHKDLIVDPKIQLSEKIAIVGYEILYHYGGVLVDASLRCVADWASASAPFTHNGDSLLLFNFPTASSVKGQFINRYLALGSIQYSDSILTLIYHLPERRLERIDDDDNTIAIHSRFIQSVLTRFRLPHNILTKDAQRAFRISNMTI
jgi:hypothetical protein